MTTFTIYFNEGETWTDDFESQKKAEDFGAFLAKKHGLTFTHVESIPRHLEVGSAPNQH